MTRSRPPRQKALAGCVIDASVTMPWFFADEASPFTEALLDTPEDVTVHASNPAVELLYALYFHLT